MPEPFGRYELCKRIAGGGMGEVFLARQSGIEGFEKLIVVKTLLPNLAQDEEFVAMFLDEARMAARLNHPNCCHIYDLGKVDGVLYMAMEFIHGEDFSRIVKSLRQTKLEIPVPLLARSIADAAAGLHHAHQLADTAGKPLGLIHRDVSPQNILVTFEGGVKVIDFGIARAAGRSTQTATGILKGKYAYMSPEQVSGDPFDHRLDVFALGVVFHELLTGKRLFKAEDDVQTIARVQKCVVPQPSVVNPRVPADLDPVVMKALTRSPDDRYPDAMAMRLAIEDWLSKCGAPTSNAHLGVFVRELFAERLEKEKSGGMLWDAPKEGPISRLKGAAPAPTPTPTPMMLPDLSDAAGSLSAQALEATIKPAPAPRRTMLWWGVGAAVAMILGVGTVVALRARSVAQERDARAAVLAAAAMRAELTIQTTPPAEIVVDGRPVGRSPVSALALQAGARVRIEASAPGHEKLDVTETLASGPQQKSYTLEKSKVTIVIVSEPAGAKVQLGGLDLGVTPYLWRVEHATAPVELTLVRDGFKPAKVTVTPTQDGTTTVPLERAGKGGGKHGPAAPVIMEGR